jgi:glycosyltransferase involved in cell wall biosynthesis
MRIVFLLPRFSRTPVGGFRVVYEYARRLAWRGHRVTVIHPRTLDTPAPRLSLKHRLWPVVRLVQSRIGFWFPTQGFRMLFVEQPAAWRIPDSDVAVATGWRTARWVSDWPSSKGRKYYLVQHYEVWDGPEAEVDATWRLPLHKIVIARWLYELGVTKFGQRGHMTHVPNGLDLEQFRLLVLPEQRNPHRVGMLYHRNPWKGTADGLKALEMVKARVPDLSVVLYGAFSRGSDVPAWMDYVHLPSPAQLVRLYNDCSVFVSASWSEGWGLPGAESMACGAALVATDSGGVLDYAVHEETALLSPPRDVERLAENIWRAVTDQALRLRLAWAGHQRLQAFTWERAVDTLEQVFLAGRAETAATEADPD